MTYVSNLFDTFFAGGKDHRTRVSAGNMPYLEGAHRFDNELQTHAALPATLPHVWHPPWKLTLLPADSTLGLDGRTAHEACVPRHSMYPQTLNPYTLNLHQATTGRARRRTCCWGSRRRRGRRASAPARAPAPRPTPPAAAAKRCAPTPRQAAPDERHALCLLLGFPATLL